MLSTKLGSTPDLETVFEERGLRWTPQRQLVLAVLQGRGGHLSAEEIHAEISRTFPKVNITTVYRTLEVLCEAHVLVAIEPAKPDTYRRFELVQSAPHYHLICTNCSAHIELEAPVIHDLQAYALLHYGFKLQLSHFVGTGLCQGCQPS